MAPFGLESTAQADGGVVMVCWLLPSPLSPNEHQLNAAAYQSLVADHIHPFTTTVLMAVSSRITHTHTHSTNLKSP